MRRGPCVDCERKGCGAYHDQCEAFHEWQAELRATRKWLGKFVPFMNADMNRAVTKAMQRKTGRNP